MLDAPGAGLAAPQIGVGLRVFTYYVDDVVGHLVNPEPRPVRREPGRRRGLPVDPRAGLRLHAGATASWRRASTCTASRSSSRAPSCWPAASSTRPTTSTASCSSTGSTRAPQGRLKAIREAEWCGLSRAAGQAVARTRCSGAGSERRRRCGWSSPAPPRSPLPSLRALLDVPARGRRRASPAPTPAPAAAGS